MAKDSEVIWISLRKVQAASQADILVSTNQMDIAPADIETRISRLTDNVSSAKKSNQDFQHKLRPELTKL